MCALLSKPFHSGWFHVSFFHHHLVTRTVDGTTPSYPVFFFLIPAARVRAPGSSPQSATTTTKRTIPVREKQQKHSRSWATMKRIDKTNSKNKLVFRERVRQTRETFRSQARPNSTQKKIINGIMAVLSQCLRLPLKMQIHRNLMVERFVAWFHWPFLFFLTFAFLTEDL